MSETSQDCVVMLHFAALMEGLEIPNIEWYLKQDPEIIRRVGVAIAHQAKQAPEATAISPLLSSRACKVSINTSDMRVKQERV